MARFITTALVVLAVAASAGATEPKENLQVFREVQRQVLRYPHFTIFDSVSAQVDNGTVTLVGKVTMPYKKNDIERRVRRLPSVERLVNKIEVLPVSQFDDELRVRISRRERIVERDGRDTVHPNAFRRFEVDEEDADSGVVADVAHAEIHAVAVVAREDEMPFVEKADESGGAALVRAMRPTPGVDRRQ